MEKTHAGLQPLQWNITPTKYKISLESQMNWNQEIIKYIDLLQFHK